MYKEKRKNLYLLMNSTENAYVFDTFQTYE